MINRDEIKKQLNLIISDFCKFVIKNRLKDQSVIKGELYTQIRRHIPQLVSTKIGLTNNNIDKIYFDINTGKINYINFISGYGGTYDKEIINTLNEVLEEINPDFELLNTKSQFSNIINNLEKYKTS